MDLGGHEGAEIPVPMSGSFSPIHEGAPKLTLLTGSSNGMTGGSNGPIIEEVRPPPEVKVKKPVRYKECQKNHAASLGGYAIDGCGEFMPGGEEGTLEALRCAACHCHRNFHRKEVDGSCECAAQGRHDRKRPSAVIPPHTTLALPTNSVIPRPPQMILALNTLPSESDDQDGLLSSPSMMMMRKRFRTKFTTEQKEKMLSFAEKLEWRIQRADEAAVQQLCSDVGVNRHVLKLLYSVVDGTFSCRKINGQERKRRREDFLLAPDGSNLDDEITS